MSKKYRNEYNWTIKKCDKTNSFALQASAQYCIKFIETPAYMRRLICK